MIAGKSLPALERTHRAVVIASTVAVTLTAWFWLNQASASHSHSVLLPHSHRGAGIASFLSVVVMWLAMSIAMMAPTTLNWLFAYTALVARSEPRSVFRAVFAFLSGYFFVWLVYSIVAAAIQIAMQRAGALDSEGKLSSAMAGLVLIGAGISYFTPLSRACLRHCRNPLTYFLTRWDNGPRGGFRVGIAHATYCVGCCWLLMLTGFAMGVMNLIWMGFLTILVCVEKLTPFGERIAEVAAVAMILWGTALSLGTSFAKV